VTRDIDEEQAADATGSATGEVVDIAAALGLAERLALNPDIETARFDSIRRDLELMRSGASLFSGVARERPTRTHF
jgi:D-arabinose 1-dehydrogenase-like Zn-dependent alcohol dehydrogenase